MGKFKNKLSNQRFSMQSQTCKRLKVFMISYLLDRPAFITRFFLAGCLLKTRTKKHFSPFLSLHHTAWWPYMLSKVEPHWCLSHQFILLTQGPIPKIFVKNIENWGSWKTQFFWISHFGFGFGYGFNFFLFFFASSPKNQSLIMG